jgi:hypothetical protein
MEIKNRKSDVLRVKLMITRFKPLVRTAFLTNAPISGIIRDKDTSKYAFTIPKA